METRLVHALYFESIFRAALEQCADTLAIPGAVSLSEHVPAAVERLVTRVAELDALLARRNAEGFVMSADIERLEMRVRELQSQIAERDGSLDDRLRELSELSYQLRVQTHRADQCESLLNHEREVMRREREERYTGEP